MQAHAIRETTHVANGRIILDVPSWMNDKDVEVIVFPYAEHEKAAPGKKRQRNLLAGKGPFKMADDFDHELPDAYWLGE